MIPEDVKKQVAEGGLRFEAYLPPEVKKELLRQMLAAAEQDIKAGKGIPHEDVIAELEQMQSRPSPEPAVWDRSMDRPLFEE